MNERDKNVLQNILKQCNIMDVSLSKYKLTPEILSDDGLLFNGCCETIFEIGEQVKRLSPEFIEHYAEQPWNNIAGMRDKIGHHYNDIKLMVLWGTITKDLPKLKQYCEKILSELS